MAPPPLRLAHAPARPVWTAPAATLLSTLPLLNVRFLDRGLFALVLLGREFRGAPPPSRRARPPTL
eukprot:3168227-Alexandrium_andersonii.AAC.1